MKQEKLLIVHLVYTLFGGVATVAGNLMKEQHSKGVKVAVAYVEDDDFLQNMVGFKFEKLQVPSPKFWGQNMLFGMNIQKVYGYFKNKYTEYEIVIHAHNVQTLGLFANLKGIPCVCTLHGFHARTNKFRSLCSSFMYRNILRKIKKKKGAIISVSNSIAKFYDPKGQYGIKTIYNGTPKPQTERQEHNEFVVGHIGDISYAKGFDALLRAFSLAVRDYPNLRLLVAGKYKTISEEDTARIIEELGLRGKVECLGFVNDASKTIMPKIDLLVLASQNEGFPMAIVEAMSYGIPVMGTMVGGIPEIIQEGYNGYFVESETDIAEKIKKLCYDEQLYTQLSINAQKTFTEKFEMKIIDKKYFTEYEQVRIKWKTRR